MLLEKLIHSLCLFIIFGVLNLITMIFNRLEYVESMVGSLLQLNFLQRLDWTMFLVHHSGYIDTYTMMNSQHVFITYYLLEDFLHFASLDRVPIARLAAAQAVV